MWTSSLCYSSHSWCCNSFPSLILPLSCFLLNCLCLCLVKACFQLFKSLRGNVFSYFIRRNSFVMPSVRVIYFSVLAFSLHQRILYLASICSQVCGPYFLPRFCLSPAPMHLCSQDDLPTIKFSTNMHILPVAHKLYLNVIVKSWVHVCWCVSTLSTCD